MERVGEIMDEVGGPIPGKRMAKIAAVHTTTIELAEIAEKAEVKNLFITHLIPELPANWIADTYFKEGMSDIYNGSLHITRDGEWIDMADY